MMGLQSFDWAAGSQTLIEPTEGLLATMFAEGYRKAVESHMAGSYGISNTRAADYARERAGTLVTDVDGVTHERVETMLQQLLGDSLDNADVSQADISTAIEGLFDDMSGQRADLIARTELGFAGNRGTISAGRDTGAVAARVSDGTESDTECQDADGQIWTLEEADINALEHPGCGRSFEMLYPEDLDAGDLADLGAQ